MTGRAWDFERVTSSSGRYNMRLGGLPWVRHARGTTRTLPMVKQQREPMLKITIHDAAGQRRLELEGRLAGVWVSELEHCWRTAQASHPNRTLAVDLTSVTFIDQAGRYLLRLMHRDGCASWRPTCCCKTSWTTSWA